MATVVGRIFNIKTLLTYSKGIHGGRDATSNGVNIDLGGGKILRIQNLVVDVQHTGDDSKTVNDGIRRCVFVKEKNNIEKLVRKNQLDS